MQSKLIPINEFPQCAGSQVVNQTSLFLYEANGWSTLCTDDYLQT